MRRDLRRWRAGRGQGARWHGHRRWSRRERRYRSSGVWGCPRARTWSTAAWWSSGRSWWASWPVRWACHRAGSGRPSTNWPMLVRRIPVAAGTHAARTPGSPPSRAWSPPSCAPGGSIRHVGVPAIAGDASGAIAAELASGGALYRELPAVPTKLMIFDRTTALVPLNPGDVGRGAFETSEPSTVHALIDVFFNQWEQAREPRTESMDMELNPREEAIVRLLAAGHTDAGVAAELKLSARTIAYTLRGLMDRYGVQNRFQLGLVLGPLAARHVLGPSQTSDTNGDTE